jgi:hypothetical protein
LYFVLETRSTAPEAIFHVLRQDTTVQSTVVLKQSLNIFDLNFILFYIILHTLLQKALCIISDFKQRSQF